MLFLAKTTRTYCIISLDQLENVVMISVRSLKRVTFELSDELHHRLKLLCYTEGISQGDVLRECVQSYTEKHDAHLIELVDKRKKELN